MKKDSISLNIIAKESIKEPFLSNPDDLLKIYLKTADLKDPNSEPLNNTEINNSNNQIQAQDHKTKPVESEDNSQQTSPGTDDIAKKITRLK